MTMANTSLSQIYLNTLAIVENACRGEYGIPEFQRQFVWKPDQILGLTDSLARGYPIGSTLTWRSEHLNRGDSENAKVDKSWLIDGQQRTTALCVIFQQKPEWWEQLGGKQVEWSEYLQQNTVCLDIGDPDFRFVMRSKDSNVQSKRYISVFEIMNSSMIGTMATEVVNANCQWPLNETERASQDQVLNRLMDVQRIKDRSIPVVEIPRQVDPTDVAEIFSRLNSRGTKVGQGDIYLAIVAARSAGWVNTEFIPFQDELKAEFGFELEPTVIFRAFTSIAHAKVKFAEVEDNFWNEIDKGQGWNQTKQSLRLACQDLRRYGITNESYLSSVNGIVASAIYRSQFPDEDFGCFLAWLIHALTKGFFSGSSDTKMGQVINALNKGSRTEAIDQLYERLYGYSIPSIPAVLKDTFRQGDFQTTYRRNNNERTMLRLLTCRSQARDWCKNKMERKVVICETTEDSDIEHHHVFPKKHLSNSSDKGRVDELANIALITKLANKEIGGENPPDVYVSTPFQDIDDDILAEHYLPPFGKAYSDWLDDRSSLLAQKSNEFLEELSEGQFSPTSGKSVRSLTFKSPGTDPKTYLSASDDQLQWVSFESFTLTPGKSPTAVKFPDGMREIGSMQGVLIETCEYLIRVGKITKRRSVKNKSTVYVSGKAAEVNKMRYPRPLSNGMSVEANFNRLGILRRVRLLLYTVGEPLESVQIKE